MIHKNLEPVSYYPGPELFWRKIHEPMGITSVLDVGAGHGGVFDYAYWTEKKDVIKEACDIFWIRPMDSCWTTRVGVDVTRLSRHYPEKSFDLVQCFETLEHVKQSSEALMELCKVARKLVILTSADEMHHVGPEQERIEKTNRHQAYVDQPSVAVMAKMGFKVMVESRERRQIIAWKVI